MKFVIVGGVAAGAGAAARLRRLDENAQIVLLERGPFISYANCGLPYHLGGVIPERENLLVISREAFAARFNVDVRTGTEAVGIDPVGRTVTLRNSAGDQVESYDKLLLATGSSPLVPKLPGLDPELVHQFWTIPDMDRIIAALDAGASRIVVIGAGFIGLEVAENLRTRGAEVTVVEFAPQILPTIDAEMSSYPQQELINSGISLKLGCKVTGFDRENGIYQVVLENGEKLPADLVMMCVGVKPNSSLAAAAGLKLGSRGHIVVDEHLRTSDPDIFAAGDVIEVIDPITGSPTAIPLAGPANKQARIAADNMAGGNLVYSGTFGASFIKVGDLAVGSVGLTERRLRQLEIPYRKIYTHPASSASYYPGGAMMHLKLLFAPDGRILGAQAVGAKGVDKRIDVIATAMRCGRTAPQLAELELAYAPPCNSARDPVNYLGMIARNMLDGLTDPVYADALPEGVLIDVRETEEFSSGSIPGAVNLPLSRLRSHLAELDRNQRYIVFCQVGLRGYVAERLLRQHGFNCNNLSGGLNTYRAIHYTPQPPPVETPHLRATEPSRDLRVLDVRALACPGPVVRLKREMDLLQPGEELRLLAAASFAPDLSGWLKSSGNELVTMKTGNGELDAVIRKSGNPAPVPAASGTDREGAAIILFSNDLDKALAALIVACGMAAAGNKVTIFFTFWGLSVLRRNPAPSVSKRWISRMFGWMLPRGSRKLKLSKMNMGGAGTMMMRRVMARENVPSLEELIRQARELGVKFIACEMAMNVMGLTREELIDVDEVAGVASFAAVAAKSGSTLFI